MKAILTLHAVAWNRVGRDYGSASVSIYRVDGLPQGEEVKIANYGAPHGNDWRIIKLLKAKATSVTSGPGASRALKEL
jgi:hypothetical protein